ncbi:MAG: hypothetical protein QXP98_02045 [Thermoproteus sp.]
MIEVVAFVPARVGICRTCDEVARAFKVDLSTDSLADEADPDFAALVDALARLGDVPVRFTSPMSLRGLYLMIKYRTGRVPLVIVNGRLVHSGPVRNSIALSKLIKENLT